MEYRIVKKPAFDLVGKSKKFSDDNFFKEAPAFWKGYVCEDECQRLWNLINGKWG